MKEWRKDGRREYGRRKDGQRNDGRRKGWTEEERKSDQQRMKTPSLPEHSDVCFKNRHHNVIIE